MPGFGAESEIWKLSSSVQSRARPGWPGRARAQKTGASCTLPGGGEKEKGGFVRRAQAGIAPETENGAHSVAMRFWAFVCFASTAGYAIIKKTGPRGGIIQPCARKKGGELPCFVRTAGRTLRGTSAFARAAGPVWRRQVPPGQAGSSLPPPPRLARRRAGSSLPPPSRLERHRAGSSPFMAAMRQAGRHGL